MDSGLTVFRSNRLEVLVELLASQLALPPSPTEGDPLAGAFAELEVVVGSRGMERHLRHALAERLGICARVSFPFPTSALDAAIGIEGDAADPWSPSVRNLGAIARRCAIVPFDPPMWPVRPKRRMHAIHRTIDQLC